MTTPVRQSIKPTYDSRKIGLQYHVTTRIDDRTIGEYEKPIPDPFARTDVRVGWRDLLKGLLRGRLLVTVIISGTQDRMDDVMELDENTLLPNSTRRAAWDSHLNERLGVS